MSQLEIEDDPVDIEACVRHGQRPRPDAQYRIKVGNELLEYRDHVIADPVPTGHQVLEAAGLRPVEQHFLFAVLRTGMLEEIRLDETVDLFARGAERFLAFRSDRSFLFVLDDRRFEWGASTILGRVLKMLAGVDPSTHGVRLERPDVPDRLIADGERVSLAGEAVERFRTAPVFVLCIEDEKYPWPKTTITMEEIAALGGWNPTQGVIEVDEHQNERQLAPGEVITLKPGFVYGKKLCWKRG